MPFFVDENGEPVVSKRSTKPNPTVPSAEPTSKPSALPWELLGVALVTAFPALCFARAIIDNVLAS